MLTTARQVAASVLALTIALPAAAQDLQAPVPMSESEPKAESKAAPKAEAKAAPKVEPKAQSVSSSVPAAALDAPRRESKPFIHGHRYAFVAGGVLLLGGVGFGYFARGEARRAESLETARDASAALDRAHTAAATANLMYGAAGLTFAYGLLLEFLPEPAADAASLTYHF
jgi:hypothetical protein